MSEIRLAARLVRAEARCSRRSWVLAAAAIALVAALLVATAATLASHDVSLQDRAQRALGGADARVTMNRLSRTPSGGVSGLPGLATLRADYPAAGAVEPVVQATLDVTSATAALRAQVDYADWSSSTVAGMVRLESGRWPAAAGEITLSRRAAERLGVAVGAQVSLATGTSYRVTGVTVDPVDTSGLSAAVHLDDASLAALVRQTQDVSLIYLVRGSTAPLSAAGTPFLDRQQVVDRAAQGDSATGPVLAGGCLVLLVVQLSVLVVLRRRVRVQLGLLSLLGARRSLRMQLLAVQHLLVTVSGAVLGVALGLGAAAALHPVLADRAQQIWPALAVPWTLLVALTSISVVTATGYAVLSVLGLSRLGLRQVVTGRDQITTATARSRWWVGLVAVGALGVALGAAAGLPAPVVVGVIAAALGAAVLGVRASAELVWRLPVRRAWLGLAARFGRRLASGPRALAAALGAATSLAVLAGFLLTSLVTGTTYVPSLPAGASVFSSTQELRLSTQEAARTALGSAAAVTFRPMVWRDGSGPASDVEVANPLLRCQSGAEADGQGVSAEACGRRTGWPVPFPVAAVMSAADVERYLGAPLTSGQQAAFRAGRPLVLYPQLLQDAKLTLRVGTGLMGDDGGGGVTSGSPTTLTLAAQPVATDRVPSVLAPAVVFAADGPLPHGLSVSPTRSVLFLDGPTPGTATEDTVRQQLLGEVGGDGTLTVERGDPQAATGRLVKVVVGSGLGGLALLLASVFAGLVTLQNRRENALLDAVGATASLRRLVSVAGTVGPVVVSEVVGVAAGMAGATILVANEHGTFSFAVLPVVLAAAAIGLLGAVVASWFGTAARPDPVRAGE